MAWYNKYRPQDFSDVIGQDLTKSVLKNALEKNLIKHAYLFSGGKGIGKTTLARIFANKLNNTDQQPENRVDIIEMDAASNTGIDNIRQLIENAQVPPISGSYKIYIIDEVHMLSKSAMNALLKILEEPPQYLVFLLATTNPEKLLPTVLSRLTKLNLSGHTIDGITNRLEFIATSENLQIDQESLKLIAKRSQGSQRDAINLLETVASYNLDSYTTKEVSQFLGLLPKEVLEMTEYELQNGKITTQLLNELSSIGSDGTQFLGQLLEHCIDKNLSSPTQFGNQLIPIVASILSLNLPINSPVTGIAIIQSHLGNQVGLTNDSRPQIEAPKQSLMPLESESENTPEVSTVKKNPKIESVGDASSVLSHQSQTLNNKLETTTIDLNSVQKVLKDLVNAPDSPAIWKVIVTDLGLKIEGSKLNLSTSNGIFQAQLRSAKIQSFLKTKLKERFGTDFQIEVDKDIQKKEYETPITDNLDPNLNSENLNSEFETQPNPEKPEIKTEKTEIKKGEIFYEVYNSLPENMSDKGVPVTPKPIPAPKTELSDSTEAGTYEDIFDFE